MNDTISVQNIGSFDPEEALKNLLDVVVAMYSDKAHFFQELIQNAEDADATTMKFILYPDRLELLHDGRPFTERDFESIRDVAKSTKAFATGTIGKFGLGFKSVYGICDVAKIYCDKSKYSKKDPSFISFAAEIVSYIKPKDIQPRNIPEDYTTLFVFPFAVGKKQHCFKKINALLSVLSSRMKTLGADSMLFLKNIEHIYCVDKVNGKEYDYFLSKRRTKDNPELTYIEIPSLKKNDGANDLKVRYMVFSRKCEGIPGRIDIAFKQIKKNENSSWRFDRVFDADVYVYFPTGTKSKLDFIIQGPFATTPNRQNISFDLDPESDNSIIVEELSRLLVDSVKYVANKMPQLYPDLLELLPINTPEKYSEDFYYIYYGKPILNSDGELWDEDYESKYLESIERCLKRFSSMKEDWQFASLYIELWKAFMLDGLIPDSEGKLIKANEAVILTEKLFNLFSDEQLQSLQRVRQFKIQKTILRSEKVCKYFKDVLKIDDIDKDDLPSLLRDKEMFFRSQNNEWYKQFIDYLKEVTTLFPPIKEVENTYYSSNKGAMYFVPFIKTNQKDFIAPYHKENNVISPNVYYCAEENPDPRFVYIDRDIFDSFSSFFTDTLGIKALSIIDITASNISDKFSQDGRFEEEEVFKSIKDILAMLPSKGESFVKKLLKSASLICAYSIEQEESALYNLDGFDYVFTSKTKEGINSIDFLRACDLKKSVVIDEAYYSNADFDRELFFRLIGVKDSFAINVDPPKDFHYSKLIDGTATLMEIDSFSADIGFVFDFYTWVWGIMSEECPASKYLMQFLNYYSKHLVGSYLYTQSRRERRDEQDAFILEKIRYRKWIFGKDGKLYAIGDIEKKDLSEIYSDISFTPEMCKILSFEYEEPRNTISSSDDIKTYLEKLPLDARRSLLESLFKEYGFSSYHVTEVVSSDDDDIQYDDEEELYNPLNYGSPIDSHSADFDMALLCSDNLNVNKIRQLAKAEYERATPVVYEKIMRSVRVSLRRQDVRAYVGAKYRLQNGKHLCQLCGRAVDSYESVQLENSPKKEIPYAYLCMCLECAEEYRQERALETEHYKKFLRRLNSFNINSDVTKPFQVKFKEDKKISFIPEHCIYCIESIRDVVL